MAQLDQIDHVVHLMLENRSFDQMLGFLYTDAGNVSPAGHAFDGLTGDEWNPDDQGRPVHVYKIQASDPHPYFMPGADPGEGYDNTVYQLYAAETPPGAGTPPTNMGFVRNFKSAIASDIARKYKDTLPGTLPAHIMGMYTPELLPVLNGLAKAYAVCDAWFSSVPTMTMPNRAFALAATSQGHLRDKPNSYTCPSIFGRLSEAGADWAVFGYNAEPKTRLDFTDTRDAPESHFGHFRDFQDRAAAGTLPAYSFLEPSWDAGGNSQHPNYDVAKGEQLIRDVYDAVRTGPDWASTLLIVTYDEHGGNYDHVPPPADATPPGDGTVGEEGFGFDRFGVRVPAVLVSPLIAPGTVFRGSGRIDHTSVLKTISERWNTRPLTDRDRAAASLADVLTLTTPQLEDRIAGVLAPDSQRHHPGSAVPSKIDLLHAASVAALPIRNAQGHFEENNALPPLESAAEVAGFIRDRMGAWKEHLQRQRHRREIAHATSAASKG